MTASTRAYRKTAGVELLHREHRTTKPKLRELDHDDIIPSGRTSNRSASLSASNACLDAW